MRNKPNLDLLRAFAIILVMLDHTLIAKNLYLVAGWQPLWLGLVGVYIFFVHTCLVLMWSLERKPHTLDFYIRRIFRIYPLAVVSILLALLFHKALGNPPYTLFFYTTPGFKLIVENTFLLQNFLGARNILGVLWSLPLEIDMYFVLPVLFFFVRRNFSLWPMLVLWTLAVAVARGSLQFGNNMVTVIPCFLPGVMAYILFRRVVNPRLPSWLFPIFLLLLTALYMHRPSVKASWPLCLALGLGIPFFRQITFPPLIRISHEIAKYSYAMYLGHCFAIALGFYALSAYPLWLQLSVLVLSLVAFCLLAYHTVEKPMMDIGAKLAASAELRYEQRHIADFT